VLKVLHIISDTNIGGAGRHLLTFLEHYDRSLLEAAVLCPPGSLLAPRCAELGVEVREVKGLVPDRSFDPAGTLRLVPAVAHYVHRRGFGVVHTHASLSGRLAALAARAPRTVYTRHRLDWSPPRGAAGRLAAALNRLAASRVIAVSGEVARALAAEGVPPGRIAVIRHGIDAAGFRERAKRPPLSPLPPKEGPVVSVVARLEPEKGVSVFLEAAALVAGRAAGVSFWVAGVGSQEKELKAAAQRLGLGGRVFFLGFREDVPAVLARTDVLAVPSLSEAFGLCLLEGMCLGIPCVASDTGGLVEVAGGGEYALLVPPGDASALAAGILRLLEDPVEAASLGRRAAGAVEGEYSAKAMAQKMTELYYSLF